jgi:hypothetical protein
MSRTYRRMRWSSEAPQLCVLDVKERSETQAFRKRR